MPDRDRSQNKSVAKFSLIKGRVTCEVPNRFTSRVRFFVPAEKRGVHHCLVCGGFPPGRSVGPAAGTDRSGFLGLFCRSRWCIFSPSSSLKHIS